MVHGSWGTGMRVRHSINKGEGDAVCFVGSDKEWIVLIWDGTTKPAIASKNELCFKRTGENKWTRP